MTFVLFVTPITQEVYHLFLIVQDEHKRTLHFQNDTENKWGTLRTAQPHQLLEKL
jgi:hypothetical protein